MNIGPTYGIYTDIHYPFFGNAAILPRRTGAAESAREMGRFALAHLPNATNHSEVEINLDAKLEIRDPADQLRQAALTLSLSPTNLRSVPGEGTRTVNWNSQTC